MRDSQSNRVYFELRRKILASQLTPGTRLKEEAWAKKMEVSRVAVRECLSRLLGENLLELGEKGGYYVKSVTAEDFRKIRELRAILEIGALKLAFYKINDQDFDELERICEDFTSMVKGGYFNGAMEADLKFHETLIDIARNDKLKDVYQMSNIPLFHSKIGMVQTIPDKYACTDIEHREIVQALKAKDLARAEEVLLKHLSHGNHVSFESVEF